MGAVSHEAEECSEASQFVVGRQTEVNDILTLLKSLDINNAIQFIP